MQSAKTILIRSGLAIAVIGLLFWISEKHRGVTVDGGFRITMGTVARILVVAQNQPQADAAIDAAFDKIYDIERLMSDYDPNSQLSLVNREAFEHPVPVDAELFEILTAAKLYSCTSGGAFDVTIGPVVQIWRKAKEDGTTPTPETIAAAQKAVGYENLILDAENRTVKFAKKGMFLDLGGIAKGYAIDKAIEVLQTAGLKGGMVDIGGDLRCFGTPANGKKHWFIGLQDPQNEEDILLKLNMDDRAVATSGDYRRFVMIDDEKHSHIIDPATADSAAGLSSVTIIAPTAMAADALATAVTVMGDEKGLKLIETIDSTEAILISHGDETSFQKTSGVDKYTDHD
ncbi:MAG: FAD:protein FMN transferase [Planctomycetota bacterium]|jgi:thiamine biosynthesis lipoprotein